MKTRFLTILMGAFILFTSCEKEEVTPTEEPVMNHYKMTLDITDNGMGSEFVFDFNINDEEQTMYFGDIGGVYNYELNYYHASNDTTAVWAHWYALGKEITFYGGPGNANTLGDVDPTDNLIIEIYKNDALLMRDEGNELWETMVILD